MDNYKDGGSLSWEIEKKLRCMGEKVLGIEVNARGVFD